MTDRGVVVRCLAEIHGGDDRCVWQTPTQAVEEMVRVILGDDSAQIGVRWAQCRIVGLLYNGHPLGKSEWDVCLAIGLPVIAWDGPPREAWEIDVGRSFRCNVCKKVVPSEDGAADDMPAACSACWNKAHNPHGEQLSSIFAAVRKMTPTGLVVLQRLMATANQVMSDNLGAYADDVVRKVGQHLSTPVSEAPAPIDEQYGATLSAHCGTRPWDDMAGASKALWIERARRLRKRWAVDEMADQLNANTDAMAYLRDACCNEAEYITGKPLIECATAIIKRLRQHVVVNRDGWNLASKARNEFRDAYEDMRRQAIGDRDEAKGEASLADRRVKTWENIACRFRSDLNLAEAQRDFQIAELNKVWDEIRLEPEADGADGIADAAIAVIRRLRHVSDVARLAVQRWQDNPRWLSGSSMYDLRAALEQK